jgi:hypothetical protein
MERLPKFGETNSGAFRMLDVTKVTLASQYEAVFLSLQKCIDLCPDETWDGLVANHLYCQAIFHALFFGDLYLGRGIDEMKSQSFHHDMAEMFRDYEELAPHQPKCLYLRSDVQDYLSFCRAKAVREVAAETAESLSAVAGISWHQFSRLEMHVYNIRHLQHHVAQLNLRLRWNHNPEIAWVKHGDDRS